MGEQRECGYCQSWQEGHPSYCWNINSKGSLLGLIAVITACFLDLLIH